jgi:hypothetical protein
VEGSLEVDFLVVQICVRGFVVQFHSCAISLFYGGFFCWGITVKTVVLLVFLLEVSIYGNVRF